MKPKSHHRRVLSCIVVFLVVGSWVFAQGTDPSAVKPAWQIEKEIVVQKNSPLPQFDLAYVGYDYPTLYGSLADYLSPWASPINFALGIETITGTKSAFISGIELEFLFTVRSNGSRFFMNDLVLFGYSFDLTVLRLNAGVRLGLSLLDVTDGTLGNGTYTAIGGTIGPEVSLYIPIAKDNFLYLRSRYTSSAFVSLGSAADPINSGNRDLQILSIQAGLGFKL